MESIKKLNDDNIQGDLDMYTPVFVEPGENQPIGSYSQSKYAFMFDSQAKVYTGDSNNQSPTKQNSSPKLTKIDLKPEMPPIEEKPPRKGSNNATNKNPNKVDTLKKTADTINKPSTANTKTYAQLGNRPNTKTSAQVHKKSFRSINSPNKDKYVYEKAGHLQNNVNSNKRIPSSVVKKTTDNKNVNSSASVNKNLFKNGNFDSAKNNAESKVQENKIASSDKKTFIKTEDSVKKTLDTELIIVEDDKNNIDASRKQFGKPKSAYGKKVLPKKYFRY